MSETSPATCMSTTSDSLPHRCNTVGRVLPHTHLRIVDPRHSLYPSPETPSVPLGQAGELWSGGYAVMKGYWGNEVESDKVGFVVPLPEGEREVRAVSGSGGEKKGRLAPEQLDDPIRWIRTGDQATMDPEGYVKIVGRIKDIIIRGGENLFPVVIEARMLKLPGVEDASYVSPPPPSRSACARALTPHPQRIISIPDPIMGEVVGAFIQRSPSPAGKNLTSEMIRAHITTLLGHQSAPDWVFYNGEQGAPAHFPVTQSGKIVSSFFGAEAALEGDVARAEKLTDARHPHFFSACIAIA